MSTVISAQIALFLSETQPVHDIRRAEQVIAQNRLVAGSRTRFGGNADALKAMVFTETELVSAYRRISELRNLLESVAACIAGEERLAATRLSMIEAQRACIESRDRRVEALERELARRA